MKFILGTKLGMTQVFRENGIVVPVTRVKAGPCVITQVKKAVGAEVGAVQIGFGEQKTFRLPKAQQQHLKGLATVRFMRDIRTNDDEHGLQRGDTFTVKIFEAGEKVQVIGKAKGRGFQGVVKRHNFKGGPASHGHKDQERMPGSIGATGPARVFKDQKMPGHMGDNRVTVKNLEVVEIFPEENELLLKGAVPGARGGLLIISTQEGKIEIGTEESNRELVTGNQKEDAVVATEEVADKKEEPKAKEKKDTVKENENEEPVEKAGEQKKGQVEEKSNS